MPVSKPPLKMLNDLQNNIRKHQNNMVWRVTWLTQASLLWERNPPKVRQKKNTEPLSCPSWICRVQLFPSTPPGDPFFFVTKNCNEPFGVCRKFCRHVTVPVPCFFRVGLFVANSELCGVSPQFSASQNCWCNHPRTSRFLSTSRWSRFTAHQVQLLLHNFFEKEVPTKTQQLQHQVLTPFFKVSVWLPSFLS